MIYSVWKSGGKVEKNTWLHNFIHLKVSRWLNLKFAVGGWATASRYSVFQLRSMLSLRKYSKQNAYMYSSYGNFSSYSDVAQLVERVV